MFFLLLVMQFFTFYFCLISLSIYAWSSQQKNIFDSKHQFHCNLKTFCTGSYEFLLSLFKSIQCSLFSIHYFYYVRLFGLVSARYKKQLLTYHMTSHFSLNLGHMVSNHLDLTPFSEYFHAAVYTAYSISWLDV